MNDGSELLDVTAGGVAVRDDGGPGPAVVWVHPYTLDGSVWTDLWRLLPGWRHVAVDLPGHGRSRPLADGEALDALASATVDVMRHVGASRLVGLSFGSTVALQACVQAPDEISHLVLAAPAVAGWPTDPAAQVRYGQLRSLYAQYGPGAHMTRLWMSAPPDIFTGARRWPALWTELEALVGRHSWAELGTGAMLSLASAEHAGELASVTGTTLVVVGEHDMPAFRLTAVRLREVLPVCRAVEVPAAGHLPLLERPEVVAPVIDAHLRSGDVATSRDGRS